MPRTLLPLLAALLATGCAEGTALDDVDVVSATLGDVSLGYGGVIVGVEAGSATLEVVTADGDTLQVPVSISGPRLGVMVDLAYGMGIVDMPLVIPFSLEGDGGVPGSDLFGTYRGFEYGASALIGVHYATLTNENDVMLGLYTVDFGATGSFNYAWLTLAPS